MEKGFHGVTTNKSRLKLLVAIILRRFSSGRVMNRIKDRRETKDWNMAMLARIKIIFIEILRYVIPLFMFG